MRLRPHRRNVMAWNLSVGPAGRYGPPMSTRPARTGRIRRCIRTGALLMVIGLMRVARAVRIWWPLLAGMVLTAVGVVLRSGLGSLLFFPGVFLILSGLLSADSKGTRKRRADLEHELAAYSTPAQRRDLEATLDQYPDAITRELRDILAHQAVAARNSRLPAALPGGKRPQP
jgi:hypothetical protein